MYPFHPEQPPILPSAKVIHRFRKQPDVFVDVDTLNARCATHNDRLRMENNLRNYGMHDLADHFWAMFIKGKEKSAEDGATCS